MRRLLLSSAAIAASMLLTAGSVRADVVHLANGGSVEGDVSEADGMVTVKLPQGTVRFPKSHVVRIEYKDSLLTIYARKRAELPPGDAAARVALARWAMSERMQHQAQDLYREALEIDPNNVEARAGLAAAAGSGAELTPEERLAALGLSRFEGEWMTPGAAGLVERARSAAEGFRKDAELARQEIEA